MMKAEQIAKITREPFRLGRRKAIDALDRNYAAAAHILGVRGSSFADLSVRKRRHKRAAVLNQRSTSACVLWTMGLKILSGPVMQPLPGVGYAPVGRYPIVDEEQLFQWLLARYTDAQGQDEWPGAEPEYYGTSGRAGAKVFRDLGYFDAFYWLNTVEEIARYLILHDPVPLGLDWTEGMDEVDAKGFIHPTGNWRGGHEILAGGVNTDEEYIELWQSWGTRASGAPYESAKLSFADLDYLLRAGGDALAIPELRVPRVA